MADIDITIEDGKYRIRGGYGKGWELTRYDEEWTAYRTNGPSNLEMAMAYEIDRLRKRVSQLGEALSEHLDQSC